MQVSIPRAEPIPGFNQDIAAASITDLGDKDAQREAIRKIRAMQSGQPSEPQGSTSAPTLPGHIEDDEPQHNTPQDAVSKRSVKADEIDEIEIEIDGQVHKLSKEELKKGAGLYNANNKKAEELAKERKALEAQRAELAGKLNSEVQAGQSQIAQIAARNEQIDQLLEYAYRQNTDVLQFKDGSRVNVKQLENELRGNQLTARRLEKEMAVKAEEVKAASEKFLQEQEEALSKIDAALPKRKSDLASYLTRSGFDKDTANALVHSKAELVAMLDKAMRFDNALNSKPGNKETTRTKNVGRSSEASGTFQSNSGNSAYSELQSEVNLMARAGKQNTAEYREALRAMRMYQRSSR